jgi:phi13 family phage major tail protein
MKIVDYRGIRGLVAAELLTDDADGITYGEPFAVAGVSNLSKTTETSSAKKYYDNVPAIVIQANGGDEVGIEASAIPEDVLAKLMGEFYDEATGMYVEGEPDGKYFAIGYITEKTDGTEMYVWRLKGQFSYPEVEHATKDDGTDSSGNTITYTGVNTQHKFNKTSKTAKAINVAAAKYAAGEKAFFEEVQTPDTVTAG